MKRYKYVLLSNDEGTRVVLEDNPIGWDNVRFSLIRDLTYFGVFKAITADFEFVGDGYRFLQLMYLRYGVDADVILRIYDGNKFFFESKVNFQNFQDQRKTGKLSIDLIQSGFLQDFQNREDVEVNLLSTESLNIAPISQIQPIDVTVRGLPISAYSEFFTDEVDEIQFYHHIVPFPMIKNDNDNVKQVFYTNTTDNPLPDIFVPENGYYTNLTEFPQTFTFEMSVTVFLYYVGFADTSRNKVSFRLNKIDGTGAILEELGLWNFGDLPHLIQVSSELTFTDTLTLNPDESIVFACLREVRDLIGSDFDFMNNDQMNNDYFTVITYNPMSLKIYEDSIFPDSTTKAFLPHEVFDTLFALITGKENSLIAPIFGRTELGYPEDGEAAYLAITNGYFLRGALSTEREFKTALRKAFKNYSSIYNLGMTISGESVTIDLKDNLLNKSIAVDLGEVSDLIIEPAKEFLFNSVKAGFPFVEYEETNGLNEFNTTVQYTNSLKSVKNELDLMSDYRADGFGIELTRRKGFLNSGTEDTKADSEIFFLDLIKVDNEYLTRRLEGVYVVSGVLNSSQQMNLRLSPGQTLLRWQKYLAIPIARKPIQQYYYQSKEKNNTLSITTELGQTVDGNPIDIEGEPYFLPEFREFNVPLTPENIESILANPLGLIQYTYFGEKFFDYLYEVDGEKERGRGNWKVLGSKPSPVEQVPIEEPIDALKYGDGVFDYIQYGNTTDDILLWQ